MASQTITGPDLQYTQDNNFCYAYSGLVGITNAEKSLLEFTSANNFLVAKIQFNYAVYNTSDFAYRVKLNGSIVQAYAVTASGNYTESDVPIHIIIPPHTVVQCVAERLDGSGEINQIVSLTGRVYAYLPVRN